MNQSRLGEPVWTFHHLCHSRDWFWLFLSWWKCVSAKLYVCMHNRHTCVCIYVCPYRYMYMWIYMHTRIFAHCLCVPCMFFVFCWRTGMLSDVLDPSNSGILLYCEIFMLIWQGAGPCSMFALAVGGRHSNYSNVLVFYLLSWLWDLLSTPSQMESVSCSLLSVIHCCYTQELLMWRQSVCVGDSMRLWLNFSLSKWLGPRCSLCNVPWLSFRGGKEWV